MGALKFIGVARGIFLVLLLGVGVGIFDMSEPTNRGKLSSGLCTKLCVCMYVCSMYVKYVQVCNVCNFTFLGREFH